MIALANIYNLFLCCR